MTETYISGEIDVKEYLNSYLTECLLVRDSKYLEVVIYSLMHLFKINFIRERFVKEKGIVDLIVPFIREKSGFP